MKQVATTHFSRFYRYVLTAVLLVFGMNVWGAEITLDVTKLGLSDSYTSSNKTIDGVTFAWTDLMKNTNIQSKASSGSLYNSTAFSGNITSVQITHTGTGRSTTVSYSTDGSTWTQVSTFSGSSTVDLSSYNCKYFKITRGSNAAYWSSVVITYESAPAVSYNYTWKSGETTYATTSGSTITLPTGTPSLPAGCTGLDFVGWSATNIGSTPQATAPAFVKNGDAATGDATYYAVFANETTGGGEETWSKTEIGDITATDEVVITIVNSSGEYYAMSNNNGTSAPTATSVTVSSNKLTLPTANPDYYKWNISKDGDNLTIYPNGTTATWLYCINTNNGVRVGTNTNKTFTIDAETGYLKHTATNRYVGVYNSADWRCYENTTGNIANQTLTFFKKSNSFTGYVTECCDNAAEFTISVDNPTLNLNAEGKASTGVHCNLDADLGGTWTYSVSPATATFDGTNFSTSTAGVYTLTATYTVNGCPKSQTATVTVTATPVITFAQETLTLEAACTEKATSTVDVSGYNCSGKVAFTLSNAEDKKFYISPTTLTPDADGKVSGQITISYNASGGEVAESYSGTLTAVCGETSAVNSVVVTASKSTVCPTGTILFKYIDEELPASEGYVGTFISATELENIEKAANDRVCHTPTDYQFVGWSSKQGEYVPVDVSSKAYIASGRTYYAAYSYTEAVEEGDDVPYTLVTNISQLSAGDNIVFASNENGVTAGAISSNDMTSVSSTFADDFTTITSLGAGTEEMILGCSAGAWTFSNAANEHLGATGAKKMAWGSGTTTWDISIDSDGTATITNGTSNYGKLYYNSTDPRFTTYTSSTQTAPQIYHKPTFKTVITTLPVCCPTVLPQPTVWTSVADGAITFNWSLSENADKVTDYTVVCRETSETLTLGKDVNSYTFTGLTNCNSYTFSVKANGDNKDVCSSLIKYTSATPSAESYIVTFDYGAGSGEPAKWTSGCDNGASVDLPTPTPPENHTFVEWRTADGTAVSSPYTPTADITLYARYQRDAAIDIVDWNPDAVTIELNTEGAATVLIENQVTGGTGSNNVADDLFFSKYYESLGTSKLLGIYNGTSEKIDLSTITIYNKTSEGTLSLAEFGHTEKGYILPNEEILLMHEGNSDVDDCAKAETSYPTWYTNKGNESFVYIGGVLMGEISDYNKVLTYGGRAQIFLKRGDVVIDIIGAKDATGTVKPSWGDDVGYTCDGGDDIYTEGIVETNYGLSTNRCLLVRKNSVKSGLNAVTKNLSDFVTLCDEWVGHHMSEYDKDKDATLSCEGMAFVGGFNYSGYYQTYEELTKAELGGNGNPDGTYTIPVPELDKLSCTKMRIQVSDSENNVLASSEYKVPIMVETAGVVTTDELFSKHGTEVCKDCDVVVLSGATLQKAVDGTTNDMPQVRDLEVYAGGTLNVPSGTNYTTRSLIMRSKADQVPVANIDGNLTIADRLYHSKRIDASRFYFFTLPYDCDVSDITYRNGELLGTSGVDYLLKYYDGEGRATGQNAGHWEVYTGTKLEAGKGYIIAVNAELTGDGSVFANNPKKEILFPMTNTLTETGDKTVAVGTYGVGDATIGDNHKGWNLIGVPFMSKFNPMSSTGLKVGTYENGDWNDAGTIFTYNPSVTVPYVTMPNADGITYTQELASSQNLEPFRSFFIQVGKEGELITDVAFSSSQRQKAALRSVASVDAAIWVELSLSKGDLTDATTIIVDDARTSAYEIGADLEKMLGYAALPQFYSLQSGMRLAFNALSSDVAASAIPLGFYAPTSDTYTIALNSAPSPNLEGVYLTDNVTGITTNLLQGDYSFTSARTANDTRFSVAVVRSVTAVDNVLNTDVAAYVSNRELHIDHAPVGSVVRVYDTLGREMIDEVISAETLQYNLPMAGVYHVQIVSENAKSAYKVVCY